MARSQRNVALGACAVAALVCVTAGAQHEGSNTGAPVGPSTGLITHVLPFADRPTQLTIVDPQRLVVSVYHIAPDSGEIQLKSVREIRWDLELSEFNSVDPQPEHIRGMIQRQR